MKILSMVIVLFFVTAASLFCSSDHGHEGNHHKKKEHHHHKHEHASPFETFIRSAVISSATTLGIFLSQSCKDTAVAAGSLVGGSAVMSAFYFYRNDRKTPLFWGSLIGMVGTAVILSLK